MEEKTRQFGPNLGVVPVTGSSISRFMRSWLRLTFLCLASIIKYPISSFVSKSTHVGIMQMNQKAWQVSKSIHPNQITDFHRRIFVLNRIRLTRTHSVWWMDWRKIWPLFKWAFSIQTKGVYLEFNGRWQKSWDWRLNALKQKARQIQILVDIVYPPKQKSFSISSMWCIHCFCVWWENAD